jgi:hypothetical protein
MASPRWGALDWEAWRRSTGACLLAGSPEVCLLEGSTGGCLMDEVPRSGSVRGQFDVVSWRVSPVGVLLEGVTWMGYF